MRGEEFVKKTIEGERDFSGIELETGFNLSGNERFEEMRNYLKKEDFKLNPFIINNSEFKYIQARGLYLPHTQGKSVNFEGANLEWVYFWDAKLEGANFTSAKLEGANFDETYLGNVNFKNADLTSAKLRGAKLEGANFDETYLGNVDFENADLQKVKNLERSLKLRYANFRKTKITSREKAIIYTALKIRELFVIKD